MTGLPPHECHPYDTHNHNIHRSTMDEEEEESTTTVGGDKNGASSSDNNHHNKDGHSTQSNESTTLAKAETRAVQTSKRIVAALLLLIAIVATIAVYFGALNSQQQQVDQQFRSYATELGGSLARELQTADAAMNTLSRSITTQALVTGADWTNPGTANTPFLLPYFDVMAADALATCPALTMVGYGPIVIIGSSSGMQEDDPAISNNSTMVVAEVYSLQDAEAMAHVKQQPPQAMEEPTLSEPFVVNDDTNNQQLFSSLWQSVLRTLDDTATANATTAGGENQVVALAFGQLSWQLLIETALPATPLLGTLDAVLTSQSCNNGPVDYTFQILEPDDNDNHQSVVYLGQGDFHETQRDHQAVPISQPDNGSNTDPCSTMTLTIYPTTELYYRASSNDPVIYAVLTAACLLLIGVIFFLHDCFVQKRQDRVVQTARRSNAIVASLFPKTVRDRMLQDQEQQRASSAGNGNSPAVVSKMSSIILSPSSRSGQLRHFLSDDNGLVEKQPPTNSFVSKPIADLFPHTTVMFADIAGFTAWSSVREPCQVFQLLETLYNAFDEIAKRRRVFKVETIGDCYVAVCGLPEPRKDHATVMARFGRDMLSAMNTLTNRLELVLGPDTGDLAMRIGLHSGPVTAGVLRGAKSRFQLFGDTVNTAARMESNGLKNRIHISGATADLLRKSGKEQWLVERPDKIVAKGKGEMQTWWLDLRPKRRNSAAASVESGGSSEGRSVDLDLDDIVPIHHREGSVNSSAGLSSKSRRLAAWNADMLIRLLKGIVARREAERVYSEDKGGDTSFETSMAPVENASSPSSEYLSPLMEVNDLIQFPKFHAEAAMYQQDPNTVELSKSVVRQVHEFVTVIASMYHDDVPFHCWEHASHVTMSVSKLLSRIVSPDQVLNSRDLEGEDEIVRKLHEHTFGITSCPLTQFAVVFSALIHDVDHQGVSNAQLVKEGTSVAQLYKNKSVAEQNSVDMAWDILNDDSFAELRSLIYCNEVERNRFRQLVVNTVMATDIVDEELKDDRNARWERAFADEAEGEVGDETVNRKATIVLEHLIQASDVAHTMQHWQIYKKWNEKLFQENMRAFDAGRAARNPAEYWYQGELGFLDFYIIPLAKKLQECGVFGVSSDEYLSYAENNRSEWELQGEEVISEFVANYKQMRVDEEEHRAKLDMSDDAIHDPDEDMDETEINNPLILPEETIHQVVESWELLRRVPDYDGVAGRELFSHLFTKCPETKVMFEFPIDMDPNCETIKSSKRFVQHSRYLILMLDRAVNLLGPDVESLGVILSDLGKKHARLGVKEEYYPFMGEALMEAMSTILGDKFTPEATEAWGVVYDVLCGEMVKAMNFDKLVLQSWHRVKEIHDYQSIAGSLLFRSLFEKCPETKKVFGFPMEIGPETLVKSRRFKMHSAYFMQMIDSALDMVESKHVEENMKRLGGLHADYGVKPEYFPMMGDALFGVLEAMLEKAWNQDTREAWKIVYDRLASEIIKAMKESPKKAERQNAS